MIQLAPRRKVIEIRESEIEDAYLLGLNDEELIDLLTPRGWHAAEFQRLNGTWADLDPIVARIKLVRPTERKRTKFNRTASRRR